MQTARERALKALKFSPLELPAATNSWVERIQEYMPALVLFWLVGATCLAMRFLGGMVYAQRMKHFRAFPAASHWQKRIEEFAERLKVRCVPVLMESGLANAPMLVGFLKPVILVPMQWAFCRDCKPHISKRLLLTKLPTHGIRTIFSALFKQ